MRQSLCRVPPNWHYQIRLVCQVPWALGKGLNALGNALGKAFAESHPRHTSHGNQRLGKAEFAECFLSGIQQTLCQVPC